MATEKDLILLNSGERRLVLGPLPNEAHAGPTVILGSKHDDPKRGERSPEAKLTGKTAEFWRKSALFTKAAPAFGVQAA